MTRLLFQIAACLVAGAALAECPEAPDIADRIESLTREARAAEDEAAGRAVSDRMWELWTQAPDDTAKELLDEGMRKRSSYDYLGALQVLDRLVAYCPAYAEGYNQRAFVLYLQGNFEPALGDLERALELSPGHVAAQSGLALTFLQLGRIPEARQALAKALAANPWLSERHLMAPGAPLAPVGQDI